MVKEHPGKTALEAIDLLGKIGTDAAEGIYVLLELLNSDADAAAKKHAIQAISKLGDVDPEVVPTLLALSDSEHHEIAREATRALKIIEDNES